MNVRAVFFFFAAMVSAWTFANTASAAKVTFGHAASGHRQAIEFRIDGQIVVSGLTYLQFRTLEVSAEQQWLQVVDIGTQMLIDQVPISTLSSRTPVEGAFFVGGHDGFARQIAISRKPVVAELGGAVRFRYVNGSVTELSYTRRCSGTLSGTSGSSGMRFGASTSSSGSLAFCGLDSSYSGNAVGSANFPAMRFSTTTLNYLLFVGDGTPQAPRQWVLVQDDVVSFPSGAVSDPNDLIASEVYWHDKGRPGQGVVLFDVSRTVAVHGMWNTFDEQGKARWYYLDGAVVDPTGRRELRVFEYKLLNGTRSSRTLGQGTLTYLDCNQAEIQVQLSGGVRRALQLKRSIPVATCAAVL